MRLRTTTATSSRKRQTVGTAVALCLAATIAGAGSVTSAAASDTGQAANTVGARTLASNAPQSRPSARPGKNKKKIVVRLKAPRQVWTGERFKVQVKTKNARKGQKVSIMTRAVGASSWTVISKGKLDRRGKATARTQFASAGRYQARAVVKKGKGRRGGESTRRLVRAADQTYQFSSTGVEGALMTSAPDGFPERSGRQYWWHPETGWFGLDEITAAVTAAEPRVTDVSSTNFRQTGGPDNTRILAMGSYYTPSAGLEPAYTTYVIFVYDPFTDRVVKTVSSRGIGWREVFGGDGNVFLAQQGYYQDSETVIAYDMNSGTEVWRRPGHVEYIGSGWGETEGYGTRGTAVIERFIAPTSPEYGNCTISTMVNMETNAAWTLDHTYTYDTHGPRCEAAIYRQGLVSLEGDWNPATDPVFDVATGTRLNIPGTSFHETNEFSSGIKRSKEGGLLAWAEESGEIRVVRNDGTVVWTLAADKAKPVNARVEALAPTTLWLRTSDQLLRVDLVTGAVAPTTEEPTFPVTQLKGGWTLYTDGLLRRDRI